MKKKSKGSLAPKLRFPEFRDAPEWEEKTLSEITSAIFDGTHQTPAYTEAGVPFYSVENLISGSTNKFISREDYDLATRNNKPEKGDILLTRIGRIGFSQVVTWEHEFSVYVTLAVIKRSSQFNSRYLHCLMQSDFYQSELRAKSLSSAVPPKINMDSLRETRVLLPFPAEQQQIADCLGSLDGMIAAEGRKLAALRDHKLGLMQQLFPQPGETLPRLRFPDFEEAKVWMERTIGDVCELKAGDFVKASDIVPERDEGMFPCYGGNGLRGFVTTFTHSGRFVLIGRQGALCGNVKLFDEEFHATEHALVASPKPNINVDWLFYALTSLKLNRFATGQAQPGLSVSSLNTVDVCVPKDEAEQQRIAACLTALDTQITTHAAKIETLKQHKRGVMQQLFPTPEAA